MRKRFEFTVLQALVGLFFVVLGVIGVIPRLQESVFSLNDNLGLEIFFGIVELVCGLLLLAGVFEMVKKKAVSTTSLILLCLWGARIFLSQFVWGLSFSGRGIFFHPSFSAWILVLVTELLVAAAILIVYRYQE